MIVIGRGVGGLTATLALRRAGKKVILVGEPHRDTTDSFWIGLWTPAIKCLAALDVFCKVRAGGSFMTGGGYRSALGGEWLARPSVPLHTSHLDDASDLSWEDPALFFVRASSLNHAMERAIFEDMKTDGSSIVEMIEQKVVDIRHSKGTYRVGLSDGRTIETDDGLVGADGTFSTTRACLDKSNQVRYRGYDVARGCSRRRSPSDDPECYQMWGLDARFATVPVPNALQQWFCTRAAHSPSDPRITSAEEVEQVVCDFHGSKKIRETIADSEDVVWQSAYESIGSVCDSRNANVFYAGDAARTLDPILAVGAGLAIEDAFEIVQHATGQTELSRSISEQREKHVRRLRWLSNASQAVGQMSSSSAMLVRDRTARAVPSALSGRIFDALLKIAIESPGEKLLRGAPIPV